mmetsp:Transcript_54271/g.117377  ORF Transcript_54271/g.117377 Transcript_54271/m.117377 type:complete len:318 (-) Transcript_54271:56-1009(-)
MPLQSLLALLLVLAAASQEAAPLVPSQRRFLPSLLLRNVQGQHQDAQSTRSKVRSLLSPDFFDDDARHMAALPGYGTAVHKAATAHRPSQGELCQPRCSWKCGPHTACDQTCEPVCSPPQCKTLCRRSTDTCETRCAEPHCAVVCPATDCGMGNCTKCKSVCAPPVCTTQCGEEPCESVCEHPKCSWKCHAPSCPRPKCELSCQGVRKCSVALPPRSARGVNGTVPRFEEGQSIVAQGSASLNPADLAKTVTPPPPWDLHSTKAPPEWHVASTQKPVGLVRALKRRWANEDDTREDRKLPTLERPAEPRGLWAVLPG